MILDEFKEKYGLITQGIRRFYVVSPTKRVFGYERANLFYIRIEDFELKEIAWSEAIPKICSYMQNKYPKNIEELKSFRCEWSKGIVFDDHKFQVLCTQISDNIWINNCRASTHGIMLIQDLIRFYNVNPDTCKIILWLPSMSEPLEVIKHFKMIVTNAFQEYLFEQSMDEKESKSVIRSIELLNKVLMKMNYGSNDFFLIDNRTTLSLVKSKCLKYCQLNQIFNQKQMKLAEKYLDYYTNFFYKLEKALNK